ncbi:MAG: hypothetical protein U0527_02095 [Candidatus Eisenbacteria bacterium]
MKVQRRFPWVSAALTLAALAVLNVPSPARAARDYSTPLTIEDRVRLETAVERVYWEHRIWPEENRGPKPALEAVLPEASIRESVEDCLAKSAALEQYWQQPVTPLELQAEIDRMSQETKQPAVLSELFAALDNDTYLIAECLARPTLVDRRIRALYASDPRFHGLQKQEIEAELSTVSTAAALRGLRGAYREVLLKKAEAKGIVPEEGAGASLSLDAAEWQECTARIQGEFAGLPINRVSALHEDADRWFVLAAIDRGAESVRLATVEWRKRSFEEWWSEARPSLSAKAAVASSAVFFAGRQSPSPANADDTWSSTSTANAPVGRYQHTAVWTGTEMIVWGGFDGVSAFLNNGGRYNPATNSWAAGGTATFNAPSARQNARAVWTGTEMIVWGGYDFTNLGTGGRYNPTTNTWAAGGTSTTGAPSGRQDHVAVWSGNEMVVWGGFDGVAPYTNTGGRYNPTTNSWAAGGTSITSAPSGRYLHVAVWTGGQMIVWGGYDGAHLVNTGGRYTPATNTWVAGGTNTTNAPTVRYEEGAVWTGARWSCGAASTASTTSTREVATIRRPTAGWPAAPA